MSLLTNCRRHGAKLFIVGLLALPLAATVLTGPTATSENRALAAPLERPSTWREALALPAAADRWISDHVGWRAQMIAAYTWMRHRLFGRFPTHQVIAGQGGRIFLAAHSASGTPNTAIALACGWNWQDLPRIAADANRLVRTFQAKGMDAKLLIVPSSPVVYAEQLPAWMTPRCSPAQVPGAALLASPLLEASTRKAILFPLDALRAGRNDIAPFPLTFFHWSGAGPRTVAGLTQEHFWQRPASGGTPIPLVQRSLPSDISGLFPGISLDSVAGEPDFAGTTMSLCHGAPCFPGMEPLMAKLFIVGRIINSAPGLAPRLVLITDSFGLAGAPWFARYYREVVYVSTNALAQATVEELAQLRALLFRPGSGDELMYMYHDATVYQGRVGADLKVLAP